MGQKESVNVPPGGWLGGSFFLAGKKAAFLGGIWELFLENVGMLEFCLEVFLKSMVAFQGFYGEFEWRPVSQRFVVAFSVYLLESMGRGLGCCFVCSTFFWPVGLKHVGLLNVAD